MNGKTMVISISWVGELCNVPDVKLCRLCVQQHSHAVLQLTGDRSSLPAVDKLFGLALDKNTFGVGFSEGLVVGLYFFHSLSEKEVWRSWQIQ